MTQSKQSKIFVAKNHRFFTRKRIEIKKKKKKP